MEVITCHIYADLDALSSMVFIQKRYPKATLVLSGNVGRSVKSFINLYQDILHIKKIKDIDLEKISRLIIVDTSKKNRIGEFEEILAKESVEVVIYDHHCKSEEDIENYVESNKLKVVRGLYGSNTTNILLSLLEENKDLEISEIQATLGLMGIYEDTGNFTFDNTTPMDLKMGSYLLERGADLGMVQSYIQRGLKKEQLEVFMQLLENEEIYEVQGERILITFYKSEKFILGLDEITNKIQHLSNATISIILCGNNEKLTVIGRSSNKVDIRKVLDGFFVGGHQNAVSGTIKNREILEVKMEIKEELKKWIIPMKTAKDIMNSPVKTMPGDAKVKTAYKVMYRLGYNGLLVVKKDKLIGIITRRSIDKALNHGFSNAPISAYMTTELIVGDPNMSIEELKALIIENTIGRIPILGSNGEILGIVTRKDILESIYEKNPIRKEKKLVFEAKIKKLIQEKIPNELLNILKKIEIVSKSRGEKAFLVGGIVRDLILGIENKDIDIVVEGDSIEFAKDLNRLLGGKKVITHKKFKTAVIIVDNSLKIDIAGARLEYYEYPTSLPIVEYGSIKNDMYRRDFTINAMALEIDNQNFGVLIDYYNGYEDLKNKKIRILHNLSFIEDPTRIIRAFRFASRYDFGIEKDTEMFLKRAVEKGFLKKVSWPRVKQEIKILFADKNIMKALDYMEEYKVFKQIHNDINYNNTIKENVKEIIEIKNIIEYIGVETWIIVFLVILENLKKQQLDLVFQKFNFSKKFIEKYDYGIVRRMEITKNLIGADKNSKIYIALENISLEVILLIYIQNKDSVIRKKIKKYLYYLRVQSNIIKGKDLIELGLNPGKEFREKLGEYFLKQLDMENPTKYKLLNN